jgi:cobalamin synthase
MAKMADRNLLTIGALFVIIVISILLYATKQLTDYYILPTVIALFGIWLMVLAVMQLSNPEKYGRGAFSYFGWGLLLIAVGGAWFLYTYNWIYSLAVILLALGALAVAAAFRRK